jgi:hypothetical protein
VNTLKTNHRTNRLSKYTKIILGAATATASLLASAARPALAANVLLSNGNSTVTIDPNTTAGVEDWTINGTNQLNQEWFWYRTGNQTGQSSLNSLGGLSVNDVGSSITELTYGSSSGLQITVTYSLDGGLSTSKTSDLNDSIEIDNNGSSSKKIEFFEYADFDLGGLSTGQTVTITTGSDKVTGTGNGYQLSTSTSPTPTDFEANIAPNLLNQISSSSTSATLTDVTAALGGEWGYQWNLTIPSCGSVVIEGDQTITGSTLSVPEPVSSSMAMFGLGGLFLSRPRRRDEDADRQTMVHVGGA